MKLKNKILLPIFTVGATAAVATPLLTSCGKKISWDDYYVEIPTIAKGIPRGSADSFDEISRIYINHIAENSEIWQQDLRFYHSYNVYSFVKTYMETETVFPNINFNLKASNIKVESDIANNIAYLTYDLSGSITVKLPSGAFYVSGPGVTYSYYEVDLNRFNLHVEHFPYGYTSGASLFFAFGTKTGNLGNDVTWSVDADVNGKIIGADSVAQIYVFNNDHYRFDYSTYSGGGSPIFSVNEDMVWSWFVSMTSMPFSYHMSEYWVD